MARNVANEHASFTFRQSRDAEEIPADSPRGQVAVNELERAVRLRPVARKNRVLLGQHR